MNKPDIRICPNADNCESEICEHQFPHLKKKEEDDCDQLSCPSYKTDFQCIQFVAIVPKEQVELQMGDTELVISDQAYHDLHNYLETHESDIALAINDFDKLRLLFREVMGVEPKEK